MKEQKENLIIKEVRNMEANTNFVNVGQEKDTELNYVSSVSNDGINKNISSTEIISQDEFNNEYYRVFFGEDMEEDVDFSVDNKEEKLVLIDGKSYPGILTDVKLVYDEKKGVWVLVYRYRLYVNYSHVKEVEKKFCLYDVNKYRLKTVRSLSQYLSLYGLQLMGHEYWINNKLLNGCRWLVGTRVEIKQRNYKGEKCYMLVATERKEFSRVDKLWQDMLEDKLNIYLEYKQNSLPML